MDYYRKYDRERGRTQKRIDAAARYQADNPEKTAKAKAGWIAGNQEKRATHIKTGNAIRDGRLRRMPCEKCGAEPTEAHHEDYSKPLEVIWLCPRCHKREHSIDG
ncbi:MAG: hypothetical protein ACYTBJ_20275 [Planctomycetota bacterium]